MEGNNYSLLLFSNKYKQHINTTASIMNIKVSIVFQFLMPTTKKPVPNPISGKITPIKVENLIFIINNTPVVKKTMPKINMGIELGSSGVLNMGRRCNTPVSNNRPAAR